MQRLPPHRIQRAQEISEIGLQENPAAAGLGTGDQAALRPGADFLGVHAQESGGLVEIERPFSDSLRAEHGQLLSARDLGEWRFPKSNEPPATGAALAGAPRTGFRFARSCTSRAQPIAGHVRGFGSRVGDAAARHTFGCIPAEGTSGGPRFGPDVICLSRGSSRGRYRPRATRGRRFATSRSAAHENAFFEGNDRTVSAL